MDTKICILASLAVLAMLFGFLYVQKSEGSPVLLTITHVCDERGVCCYERRDREFSCVATIVQVVVLPGDVQNGESQGYKPSGGEVGSRALEERLLKEHRSAFFLKQH